MPRYRVSSGEFEVIVTEKSLRFAGNLAIRLHNASLQVSALGELTLVQNLKSESCIFISTQRLLESNNLAMGSGPGQYSRKL